MPASGITLVGAGAGVVVVVVTAFACQDPVAGPDVAATAIAGFTGVVATAGAELEPAAPPGEEGDATIPACPELPEWAGLVTTTTSEAAAVITGRTYA